MTFSSTSYLATSRVCCMHFVSFDEHKEMETLRDEGNSRNDNLHFGGRKTHTPLHVARRSSDGNHKSSCYHYLKGKCVQVSSIKRIVVPPAWLLRLPLLRPGRKSVVQRTSQKGRANPGEGVYRVKRGGQAEEDSTHRTAKRQPLKGIKIMYAYHRT